MEFPIYQYTKVTESSTIKFIFTTSTGDRNCLGLIRSRLYSVNRLEMIDTSLSDFIWLYSVCCYEIFMYMFNANK